MPRMDGTGPMGTGPLGRGLGPCGAGRRGVAGPRWFGRGFGYGSGWLRPRWGCFAWGAGPVGPRWGLASAAPQDEVQVLKQEAAYLQEELAAIQKRLAELEPTS
ncbi:MAG: DUF5320 domain-containing protein [Desulfobacca sp.]|uniref:DUF5320 domain-containing protein n=1 Tax=Desulfobacca sp. TaxID=2067990 RepID=UPI00404A8CF5